MTINDIEGGRAKAAYTAAKNALDTLPAKHKKEYVQYTKKVPMMIRNSGLGNTFAFIFSVSNRDKGRAWQHISDDVLKYLREERSFLLTATPQAQSMTEAIVHMAQAQYAAATEEVMAFFDWLRRSAEGLEAQQALQRALSNDSDSTPTPQP